MAYDEGRALRNGIPVPIQCLRQRLKPAGKRPLHPHYHEYSELLFGLSGKARVVVGAEEYILCEGDTVLIHHGVPHDVLNAGMECDYIVVKFLPSILLFGEQTNPEYGHILFLMENTADRQILFSAEECKSAPLRSLFLHLMEEWERQEFGYELSLRADVTHIFLCILRKWREKNRTLAENAGIAGQHELIRRAIRYIGKNYAELTEDSTAKACGVSASYLSRVFKRGMKLSFSAYVNNVRLREAERLLLTTDQAVTEIAQTVGFSTSAYLTAQFRKAYRVPPRRYRDLARGE